MCQDGDKRRNKIHLKDAGIPKVVSNAWHNPQGSVPRKPPLELVSLKAPGGNGLPNQAVGNQNPNHSVNSYVENSGIKNGVNSTQDQKAQNNTVNTNQEQKGSEIPIVSSIPSSGNVSKLERRKEIKEKLSKPNNLTGNGDNNKNHPKGLSPQRPCSKPSVQEKYHTQEIKQSQQNK